MLNIRKYLAELMGVERITDDDIRKELDELKLDNLVEKLTKDGHIGADPEIQMLARKAVSGGASPDELLKLLQSPRPVPAQTAVITPPAGPQASTDMVEARIQAYMAERKVPYHVAAGAIATGGSIQPTQDLHHSTPEGGVS